MNTQEKVKKYLAEIAKNDKKGNKINAFLQLNPYALEEAKRIDGKIKKGRAGKLAGRIIGVKANIVTKASFTKYLVVKGLKLTPRYALPTCPVTKSIKLLDRVSGLAPFNKRVAYL